MGQAKYRAPRLRRAARRCALRTGAARRPLRRLRRRAESGTGFLHTALAGSRIRAHGESGGIVAYASAGGAREYPTRKPVDAPDLRSRELAPPGAIFTRSPLDRK